MSIIEKNISNFIENQFPEIYREEGPMFVEFVKKYYEWMEEANNTLYYSRRILDFKDIDDTVDNFVVKFKQKYLSDIQLDTVAQTRQLVKHSLDLYRSKGTERSVDLFFRAIFGKPAEVYYPGDDIFRLSDGKWVKPKYLEVTPSVHNVNFVGKQIVGINTGATAFVERYIRRKIATKYIHILYISAIANEFETGELITLSGQNLKDIPTVIGSLTTLDIVVGGSDFTIGEIVNITSNNGLQGKGRVANISNIIGTVNFELTESGWGYTTNAQVLLSEKVLTLNNVLTNANTTNSEFEIFETLKQPLANVVYKNANASLAIANNDLLYTYYANGNVAGVGRVLNWSNTTATNGEVYVAELVGTLGPAVEAAANLTGTVAVTTAVGSLSGTANITSACTTVIGTGTLFAGELNVGSLIEFYPYLGHNASSVGTLMEVETRLVASIANNTQLVVNTPLTQSSNYVLIQYKGNRTVLGSGTNFTSNFVYGDKIAIYSNSTNYIMRTVNAVTNATFMTVQEPVTFTNTSANYANTKSNNFVYVSGNTIKANIHTYTDKSVTANIMGVSSNLILYVSNSTGTFSNGHHVYQLNANNDEIANAIIFGPPLVVGSNVTYQVANAVGVFKPNVDQHIQSRNSAGSSYLNRVDTKLGVIDISGAFVDTDNNFVYGVTSQSNATISRISAGVLASFDVSNTLQFSEQIQISSEPIEPYQYLALNATSYGFPLNPTANFTSPTLDEIFDIQTFTIGGISSLISVNPGKNYDSPPFITIYDPVISRYNRSDWYIELTNATSSYSLGEIVEQDSGARGQVIEQANLTSVVVKRLKFEDLFNYSQALTGVSSGVTANIVSVSPIENIPPIGLNAFVAANVQVSSGSVTSLEVVDSGFGYIPGEDVSFISKDGLRSGLAKAQLGKKGVSEGFYKNRNGFVSDTKYVFDGNYYQDYSYEVRTSVTADKYAEMLKNVLHVAGTKMFSAVVTSTTVNTSTNIVSDITEE